MRSKNTLLDFVFITICIFSLVLVVFMFNQLKTTKSEFNEEKDVLVQEKSDLEERVESIQKIIDQKADTLIRIEGEKKSLEEELNVLKEETKRQIQTYSNELDTLRINNASLAGRITALEKKPLLQSLSEAIAKEKDEKVKKILERALYRAHSIYTKKGIEPEFIVAPSKLEFIEDGPGAEPVIEKGEAEGERKEEKKITSVFGVSGKIKKQGKVLFLDKTYNMVIINLGNIDDMKDGDRCIILEKGKETAQGEIIGVRYKVSAVLVDGLIQNYTLADIKEGHDVIVFEAE